MKAVNNDLVWFNGEVKPLSQARIGLEDRGFNFADGVYEVVRFYRGKPFTLTDHLDRLVRSAAALRLTLPLPVDELAHEMRELIAQTAIMEGMVYLQLTRGEAPRAHLFPAVEKPTMFFYARPLPAPWQPGEGAGCKLMSVPDERWKRCWIKSLALLPNVMAKNDAIAAGHDEAVFIDDGRVTECSTCNIFTVKAGKLYTCPVGPKVLPGITRLVTFRLARELNIAVEEISLPLADALNADEVFITSTTREINWVRQWDGKTITGECGPITHKLHQAYVQAVKGQTL